MDILFYIIGIYFFTLDGGKVIAIVLFILAFLGTYAGLSDKKEIRKASIDRSENIIDNIGGFNNIDINLSKYGDKSQLLILKDKSIYIGHDNYIYKKLIPFDSIVKVDIRVNNKNLSSGTIYYNTGGKDVIESIIVYIHTTESTEDLTFKYSSYETDEAQEKYNEILKGLIRFKVLLGYTDKDIMVKEFIPNNTQKSIPEQLKEYKELLDMDIITEEEFEDKKKQLLNL